MADDKLPWHQRIAIYIIATGLVALYLLIGVALVAIMPGKPDLALFLVIVLGIVGVIFIANLPLEIKKN